MTTPRTSSPYRWVILSGVWLLYFSFGLTVSAVGPMVGPISNDLGLSLTAMGGILGAWQLVYIASALPLGAALDRIGMRAGLALAGVLIGLSGLARGWAETGTELFLAVALFGLGGPLVSVGAPKQIADWFDGAGRGFAMGVYMTGVSLGAIVALSATNAILLPVFGDWRGVVQAYGWMAILSSVAWWIIASHPLARDGGAAVDKAGSLRAFRDLIGLRDVQIVLVMSVGIFYLNHGLNNWLPEILRSRGLDAVTAGFWAAIPTVVGVVGSLVIPRLATGARRLPILGGLFLAVLLATLLLHLAPGIGLVTGLILQGVARSAMMTVAILVLMDTKGVPAERAGMAGGMFFMVAEIGGVLGPFSVGALADFDGGFTLPLWSMTAVCTVLILLLAALGGRKAA